MMEGVSGFSGHWLEILAAVYLVGMVLYGHYRGFIRLCVSALALVISLVTVRVALPYVTEWLKNDTPVYESIRQGMADAVGLDGLLDGVLDIGEGTGGNGAGIGERRTIEELKLPEQMKRILIENNNREVYQMLGVERFGDYVGGYLADTVIKAAASILLFAVVSRRHRGCFQHGAGDVAGVDRKASYNKRTQPDRRSCTGRRGGPYVFMDRLPGTYCAVWDGFWNGSHGAGGGKPVAVLAVRP